MKGCKDKTSNDQLERGCDGDDLSKMGISLGLIYFILIVASSGILSLEIQGERAGPPVNDASRGGVTHGVGSQGPGDVASGKDISEVE